MEPASGLRRLLGGGPLKMQLPLTPLIDVMFQLLLFFVLTNSLGRMEGQMPGSMAGPWAAASVGTQDIVKPLTLSVRIGPDGGAIYQLGRPEGGVSDPGELYRRLLARREALGSEQVPVIVRANWDVPWRYVVEAHNQALRAKFRNVGIYSAAR